MLIIVPLLAGLWPGVRKAAEEYNAGIVTGADALEQEIVKWRELVAQRGRDSPRAARQFDRVLATAEEYADRVSKTRLDPRLPLSWSLAFFAALSVALAHLLYQVKGPELVKNSGPDAFAAEVLAGYRGKAPDRRDRLERAALGLDARSELAPRYFHPRLVSRHKQTYWLPGRADWYKDPPPGPNLPDRKGSERARVAIEEGARAEYDVVARQGPGWACLTLCLYVVGGILVAWIIIRQTLAVGTASGWW
jgi:hypothetical protein